VAHVSGVAKMAKALPVPGAAHEPAALSRGDAPALVRQLSARLTTDWLPHVAWSVSRTGRAGLVGIALLAASGLFWFSTHLEVVSEVEALRSELAAAQRRPHTAEADAIARPAAALRVLPARTDVPATLRRLFDEATRARLSIDTAKYESKAVATGGVVRHQIAFPVTGPYPQIRAFIDATLATMPEVALSGLVFERKSTTDGNVDAQIRMTIYTRSNP
jgi:hypothetical protein